MADKVTVSYSVLETTRDKIAELTEKTFRSQGNVVDLAVAELYERTVARLSRPDPNITIAEALNEAE